MVSFRCRVSSLRSEAFIGGTEKGPPTILVRPQSQQVKAGGIASFYCTAEGAPPPQIHWRKNGKRVSQSQSRYLVHTYENGALLRIEPVRSSRDNTMYECLAENGVGDAVSADAQLTVYEAASEREKATGFFGPSDGRPKIDLRPKRGLAAPKHSP
ncbi:hypothetical protein KM043_011542 [Ampulex compressa]|nr:hypothetical protein KM043_011542 [Ampulex compressa]